MKIKVGIKKERKKICRRKQWRRKERKRKEKWMKKGKKMQGVNTINDSKKEN